MIEHIACEQGSPEWHAARIGSLGASQIADATARTKSGWSASRDALMGKLFAERLTGTAQSGFVSAAMQRGTDTEPAARAAYEFVHNSAVETCGLFREATMPGTHASPDGLVGSDGLIEIKCPDTHTHLDALDGKPIPERYVKQMQWQMRLTGRRWCDFASYDDRLPHAMRLHVRRVERDDALIAALEADVRSFLDELADKVTRLTARYMSAEAA